jgi:RND family efflux transporter MFP subunit
MINVRRCFNIPAYCLLPTAYFFLAASSALAGGTEGFTEPYRKIDIGPSEPGLLAQVAVHEGDVVQAGQIVGTLECDVLQVSLEIAKAAMQSQGRIDSALAERDLHQARVEKLTQLLAAGHANREEVDRAKTELAVAEGNLQTAKDQQTVDKLEYKKTAAMIERRKLRSPIDGVVTRIYKDEQELVAGNAPTVLTVVQLNPLRVTFSVPTAQGLALKAGQSLPLVFPETSAKVTGKVEFVSPVTEAESGTVRVKVLIDNPGGAYRSGIRCALEQKDDGKQVAAEPQPQPNTDLTPEVGAAQ